MTELLNLPWLRERTVETGAIFTDAAKLKSLALRKLSELAQEKLTDSDRRKLAKAIQFDRDAALSQGLTAVRLCLASQTTTDFIADEIVIAGLRFGLLIDIVNSDFNQLADLAFGDFFEAQNRQNIDFTFMGLDYRQLGFRPDLAGDDSGANVEVEEKLLLVRQLANNIRTKTGTPCIVQNLVSQPQDWLGSIDRIVPGSMRWFVDAFNQRLTSMLASEGHYLFDSEYLAAQVGLHQWHAPGMWYMAKLGFSPRAIPYYAHRLAALLAAARGKSKRALILDLDNTLWGGVIGDDGVQGIKIGQGSAIGEAHLDVQRMAQLLKSRGVVLAVCSKNVEAIAREPFQQHTGMALRLEDFAVFQANWDDKASNVRHIGKLLNLGLDSLVFVDDNPSEREIVRRALPDVAVPELGNDPAEYTRVVMAAGYFESVAFSAEDQRRAQMYSENAKRVQAMDTIVDMDAYLASLKMRLTLRPFDTPGRARIVQLINKSNQFNLTTRRYSEPEIEAMERDPQIQTLQAHLTDTFGDNGMISVVICKSIGSDWEIDTWLMSCRVLKRQVEQQILQYLIDKAQNAGIKRLKGIYIPAPRNGLVEHHYKNLGFEPDTTSSDQAEIWWLDVATAARRVCSPLPFELV